jgi:Fe-S-cluster containining protein
MSSKLTNNSKFLKLMRASIQDESESKEYYDYHKSRRSNNKLNSSAIQQTIKVIDLDREIAGRLSGYVIVFDSYGSQKYAELCGTVVDDQSFVEEFKKYYTNYFTQLDKDIIFVKENIENFQVILDEIDTRTAAYLEKFPEYKERIYCKKGCSFCCHQVIPVNEHEVNHIISNYHDKVDQLDLVALEKQITATMENVKETRTFDEMKCAFLNDDGACTIYEQRPTICRAFSMLDKNEGCNVFNETNDGLGLVATEASSLMTALNTLFDKYSLSEMLYFKKTKA